MKQYPYPLTPEVVDCKLCTEYTRKDGCTADSCVCMEERIEANAVTYEDVVTTITPQPPGLTWRIYALVRQYERFLQADHEQRMNDCIATMRLLPEAENYRLYAVLYLLTSDQELNRRTANCIMADGIAFQFAVTQGLSKRPLTLFIAAFLLYSGWQNTVIYDICCDAELPDRDLFLILNAVLVLNYGPGVFHLKGELDH